MRKLRALSPVHIALLLPWVVAIIAARRPIRDNSFLWHVTAGSMQLEKSGVLTSDPFSFTRIGESWRTQSWLLEIAYGFLDQRIGIGFVPWLIAASALLTLGGVGLIAFRESRSVATTAVVLVATVWTAAVFLSPRPVIISYVMMAVVVLVVRDQTLRWVLPLVFWVWASVHASFPVGLAYVALDGARRRDRRAFVDVLAPMGATLFTAHGLGLVQVLLDFVRRRDALDLLTEWGVPNLLSVRFMFVPVALVLLIAGGVRSRVDLRDLIVVGPMVLFLLTASRAVLPAWIALVPFLAASATFAPRKRSNGSGPLNAALIGLIAVVPFAIPTDGGLDPERFPVGLSLPASPDRTFHDDVVGGYLIYATGGQLPVFVDDRAEVFGVDLFSAVIGARSAQPIWRDVFDEWRIDTAILKISDGLVGELQRDGWQAVDETETFVLMASR